MKYLLSTILLSIGLLASAQEGKNFSMWYLDNIQHNPAAAGANNFNMKAFANFRYQYFTTMDKPFRTISASVEGKILKSKHSKSHLGLGLSFINDGSGDGKYTVNDIAVPIAYHIYFNRNNSLSIGVSPGIYQRSVQPGNFTWESQWIGYRFNRSISPEGVANRSKAFFDLGAGLFYKYQKSLFNKFYFGVSMRHILKQNIGFNISDELYRRFYFQFGMKKKFEQSNFGISPNLLVMAQGQNLNIVGGMNFDFYLHAASQRTIFENGTYFSLGVYYRYRDAIILNLQYSINGFIVAVSYDSNINSMLPASKSVGGLEVALSYDIIFNKRSKFLY